METTQTKTRLEFEIQVFMKDSMKWEQTCIYATQNMAEKEMKHSAELEETQARLLTFEVVEEDTLRSLSFGTRPVISRTLIGTINNGTHKVLAVDNYDRDGFLPTLIQDELPEQVAKDLAKKLNDKEDDESPDYYIAVTRDYQEGY